MGGALSLSHGTQFSTATALLPCGGYLLIIDHRAHITSIYYSAINKKFNIMDQCIDNQIYIMDDAQVKDIHSKLGTLLGMCRCGDHS